MGPALRSDDQLLSEDPAWRASSASMPCAPPGADLRAALPQLAGGARGVAGGGPGIGQGIGQVAATSAALQPELDLGAWLRLSSLPAQVTIVAVPCPCSTFSACGGRLGARVSFALACFGLLVGCVGALLGG